MEATIQREGDAITASRCIPLLDIKRAVPRKPFYEDAATLLYHADMREILPAMPKGCVHLLLTDPPYGVMWKSNRRQQSFDLIQGDESEEAAKDGVGLSLRLLLNKRHLYVFGKLDLSGLPLSTQVELIWDKTNINAGNLSSHWANQHEYIQFATHQNRPSELKTTAGNLSARLRRGTVLKHKRPFAARHPTEKPVSLLRELIESSSHIGETVLDPFVGVGSTLVAARLEGRNTVGIEIDERYCQIAAERLARIPIAFDA